MEITFGSMKKKSSKSKKTSSKWIETNIMTRLPDDAATDGVHVMVTEVSCNEPDCVPLETLIICIGMQARWVDKVLKPIAEVTDSDLQELDVPNSWTAWIQSEKERKNKTMSERSAESADVPTTPVMSPVLPAPTLVTMRPRTDQHSIPQTETSTINSSTSSSAPSTASTDISTIETVSGFPPSPPNQLKPLSQSSANDIKTKSFTMPMNSATDPLASSLTTKKTSVLKTRDEKLPAARHSSKGVRQRGCPCCDPDNMDNILDKMLYFDAPP